MAKFENFKFTLSSTIQKSPSQNVYRIKAKTIEEIYKKAVNYFNIPLEFIRFEIEKAEKVRKKSLFQFNEYVVLAYPSSEYFSQEHHVEDLEQKNGAVFVRKGNGAIYIMVMPPGERGKAISLPKVLKAMSNKVSLDILDSVNRTAVKNATLKAKGTWVRVGSFHHNEADDVTYRVRISNDNMKAFIQIRPALNNGADPMQNHMRRELEDAGVLYGILTEKLAELERLPVYNQWIEVASGKFPVHEQDGKILLVNSREQKYSNTVDITEASPMHTVRAGDIIAIKQSIIPGKDGLSVLNEVIFANTAEEVEFIENEYIDISEDGKKAIATKDGAVSIKNNVITIEELLVIPGDLSPKTGNIDFPGSVIIKGDIPDDYEVYVGGNLEVHGSVANSRLRVGKNLIVQRGINGKNEANIHIKGSLLTRFLESVTVRVEGDCIVQDGVLHSHILCDRRVIAITGRGRIVSSEINSSELIQVRTIGSTLGGNSVLNIICLFDDRKKLGDVTTLIKEREEKLKEIKLWLGKMTNTDALKKSDRHHKGTVLAKVKEAKKFHMELIQLKNIASKLKERFHGIKTNGKIIIEDKVQRGTIVNIDGEKIELKHDMMNAKFYIDEATITYNSFDLRKDRLDVQRIIKNEFL